MILKLMTRNESAGNDKLHLTFSEVFPETVPATPVAGAQLSGWFSREDAMQYTVGETYDVSLAPTIG